MVFSSDDEAERKKREDEELKRFEEERRRKEEEKARREQEAWEREQAELRALEQVKDWGRGIRQNSGL